MNDQASNKVTEMLKKTQLYMIAMHIHIPLLHESELS